jgi:2-polyprenyl-3-methyl-5-hydroxy-6-metoxy-1,4-benzoquinol methylase
LDYGCGDGTFLALVSDLFPQAVGADLDAREVARSAERFSELPGISFRRIGELKSSIHNRQFDIVTCMEVLEHCVAESEMDVLSDLHRLVRQSGLVIVSVPVEIGASLIVKEFLRTLAAWRHLGDYSYKEIYRLDEFIRMVFATRSTCLLRPTYGDSPAYHGHKGFNWRALQKRLERLFVIKNTYFTPIGWVGGFVASQVWFICLPKSL